MRRALAGAAGLLLVLGCVLVPTAASAAGGEAPPELGATTARMPAGALRVSWEAPEGQLAGYVLAWASPTAPSGQRRVRAEQTSTVLTGLRPGAEYQVRAAAVRWDGTVSPAAVVQVRLPHTSSWPGESTGDQIAPEPGAES